MTAREVARELRVSVGPIFTWFETMEQLKAEVYGLAKALYREYIQRGLAGPVPFLGLGQQYIRFAKDEPELYKLLFLTRPEGGAGGAMEALRFSQDLARESVMRIYNMDAPTADRYFRDLWLTAFSICTLIVTDDCPYTDEEISAIFTEISLSVVKAFKEIPGLMEGKANADYARCVDISTKAALKQMVAPGVMAVAAPLAVGIILGAEALGGMLAGALVSGFVLAIMMANSGGSWDNAKKYIEEGNYGGKGSDAHKAAVTGDTVGDPFKDTAGPAMDILIKLMSVIALILAPILANIEPLFGFLFK